MTVGKAIFYLLDNSTDLTAIVGTRIYPEVAQQDAPLPYVVYNISNNEPSDTKREPSKMDTANIEVNCYSTSYTEVIDMSVAVRAALDRVTGTYSGVNVQSIAYMNEVIDFDEGQRAYNVSSDYDVRISRTDFEIAQGSPITGVDLGDLADVNTTGVTDGQVIAYDAATSVWLPATDAGGAEDLNDLTDVSYNPGTIQEGQVLAYEAQGQIFTATTIDTASSLDELTDVTIDRVSVDQVLQYDGADWVNATFNTATSLEDLTDVDLTVSIPNGALLIYNNNTGLWSNTSSQRLPSDGVYFHQRYQTESEALRAGATATTELYFTCTADGNGLAESASSDTPTAGNIIKRKIYYSEEGFADPDTGTWIEFTPAPADDAAFATVKAALLENLKARTGGTVPISLKQTWEDFTPVATLLDAYPGAFAAYSLRLMRNLYTGSAIRVRRDNNNEQDIGFVEGELDTVSLLAFAGGSGNAWIRTWYDQSGNGVNVTQTNTGQQPQIVSSGTVIVEANGKPAIKFDGSNDVLKNTNGWTQGSSRNDFNVLSSDGTGGGVWNTDFSPRFSQNLRCNSMKFGTLGFTSSNAVVAVNEPNASTINTSYLVTGEYDLTTTALSLYKNGSLEVTASMVNQRTGTGGDVSIGTNYQSTAGYFGGKIQEIVSYQTRKADDRADIETNIATFYDITL